MKKVTLLFITIFSSCLLQACHGIKNNDTGDTITETTDTTKKTTIILDKDDIKFMTDVAAACMAEIKIGNMAKQKGKDKRIKNFGAMMIKDLTKGDSKLVALAKIKKIALPDSITATEEKEIDNLAKKTGKDFDHAYLNKTEADHKKALDLFQSASKHAYDPDIKSFAGRHMSTIKRHLDAIDAIHDSMK